MKTTKLLLPLCLACALCDRAAAQNETASRTTTSPYKAIEVNYTTIGGFRYFTQDNSYLSDKDMEELIYPLRDFEASRLLKKSEASQATAGLLNLTGLVGVVTGIVGLLAAPADQQAPYLITAIGGAVVFDIGSFFKTESQTARFNSVQRYNRFARGEEQVLPQVPADEKSLLDFGKSEKTSISQPSSGTQKPK